LPSGKEFNRKKKKKERAVQAASDESLCVIIGLKLPQGYFDNPQSTKRGAEGRQRKHEEEGEKGI